MQSACPFRENFAFLPQRLSWLQSSMLRPRKEALLIDPFHVSDKFLSGTAI